MKIENFRLYPKPLQNLIDLFTKLPGIGPRQASRFTFFILKQGNSLLRDLTVTLKEIEEKIGFCEQCFKTLEKITPEDSLCTFCRDSKRDPRLLAVVEKESDLQNLEKTGSYHGIYHVLGGTISPLDAESPKRLHLRHLFERVKSALGSVGPYEVVLATNPTTEGDMTALYIERILAPLKEQFPQLKITRLGRGLSLGSELEYADEMTIRNAFTNRK